MNVSDLPDTVLHFAAPDAYRAIFSHGLRPARQILVDAGYSAEDITRLTSAPRPDFVYVDNRDGSTTRLAHNQPLLTGSRRVLQESLALGGCTLAEFCQMLADRVFFWADHSKADGYRKKMAADGPYDRITFRTRALLNLAAQQGTEVQVSRYNSGSIARTAFVRGHATWTSIADGERGQVTELVAVGTVAGVSAAANAVTRFVPGVTTGRSVWRGGDWG